MTLAREGVRAWPAHPVLRNNLAVLLELTGDLAEAEDVLRATLAEEPSLPQLSKNLGDLLYRGGRYDEAPGGLSTARPSWRPSWATISTSSSATWRSGGATASGRGIAGTGPRS